jgi:Xaa-Pro aminopeptidase
VERFAGVKDVRLYEGLGHLPEALLADTLRDRRLEDGRIGLEWGAEMRSDLPTHELLLFARRFPRLQFVDGAAVIWRQRLVKSPSEAACIRKACAITSAAFERLFEEIHEGMTEAAAMRAFARLQVEAGGGTPWGSIVSGASDAAMPSKPPTDRLLLRGDLVWVDGGCAVDGYWSDFSRAAVVGGPSDAQRRIQEAINRVTAETIGLIRPGARLAAVASSCYRFLEDARLPTTASISVLAGRVGHGLGLNTAEPPSLAPGEPARVLPGMVLTIEPAIASKDGIFHHEQNVLVTDEGIELLSSAPIALGTIH